MKKFTLFIALLVCAVGFSQRATNVSSLGDNNPVYAQKAITQQSNPEAYSDSELKGVSENNPVYAQKAVVQTVVQRVPQPYSESNSFASAEVKGTNVNPGKAGTASNATKGVDVVITHSNTQTIEAGAEIACADGVSFRDNSVYRDFDLAGDFGINGDFVTTAAEIAIGIGVLTPNGFPLTVNIYSAPVGSFPDESQLTLQGTGQVTITAADSETIVSVPVAATIPAGEAMILEAAIVDDGTATNYMRFGANNDGQTGISWIKADACGAAVPTDLNDFGLPNSFVMNVVGDEDNGGGGDDCSQNNPSNAFENGRGFNAANAWTAANDIIVPMGNNMSLNQLVVNAFNNPGATITSADIFILSDNGGLPDTLITAETVAPTSETFLGTNFGFDIDELVFDITPVMLPGDDAMDVTYWVAIQVTCSDGGPAYWENSTASAVGNPLAFNDGGGWTIPDATQDGVYTYNATCETIGSGADCAQTNPSNAFENGRGFNAANAWTAANDIIVPMGNDMNLNQIVVNAFNNPGATITSADIFILSDNGGLPDTLITAETVAPTSETFLGTNFGFDIDELVFDITTVELPGDAAMDVTYWVAIQVTCSDGGPAYWENSTATAVGNPLAFNDGGGWTIPDATQDGVYTFNATCDPIGGGGGCMVEADFEDSALPAGWSTVINEGTCGEWKFGDVLPTGPAFDSIGIYFDDDDACGEGSGAPFSNVSLLTDVYDTENTTFITLSYDVAFQEVGAGEYFLVEVFDGDTWQTVALYDVDIDPIFTETIDVTSYGNDAFQVRYTYDDGDDWSWHGGIDNFCLDYDEVQGTEDNVIEGFTYYPNPATNVINLDAQSNIERVAIYNILGQKVVDQNIDATAAQINVANLTTGAYLMEVSVDGKRATYKIVKN